MKVPVQLVVLILLPLRRFRHYDGYTYVSASGTMTGYIYVSSSDAESPAIYTSVSSFCAEAECLFVRNLQGDVERVIGLDGNIQASYPYDA